MTTGNSFAMVFCNESIGDDTGPGPLINEGRRHIPSESVEIRGNPCPPILKESEKWQQSKQAL